MLFLKTMTSSKVEPISLRFYQPRMIEYPGEYEGEIYSCPHCLKCYMTEMARAHHIIQTHCVGLNCFACEQNFTTFRQMALHIVAKHAKKEFVCYFCKARWQKVRKMNLRDWQRVRHHIYGELVFEKVAEYRQKDQDVITPFMQEEEEEEKEKEDDPKKISSSLKIEVFEYCVEESSYVN